MPFARILLALPAITGVFFSLVAVYTFFGMTRPNAKGPITWQEWAMAIGFGVIVLLLHTGYIAAPFAYGTSWHRTAPWWMVPTTVIAALILLSNVRWFVVGLQQEPRNTDALLRNAKGLTFGFVWYVLPTLLMWATRPPGVTETTSADLGAARDEVVVGCVESGAWREASGAWSKLLN